MSITWYITKCCRMPRRSRGNEIESGGRGRMMNRGEQGGTTIQVETIDADGINVALF